MALRQSGIQNQLNTFESKKRSSEPIFEAALGYNMWHNFLLIWYCSEIQSLKDVLSTFPFEMLRVFIFLFTRKLLTNAEHLVISHVLFAQCNYGANTNIRVYQIDDIGPKPLSGLSFVNLMPQLVLTIICMDFQLFFNWKILNILFTLW